MAIYDLASYKEARTTYYYYFQNASDPAIGYYWILSPTDVVSCLNALYEGAAVCAWYPSHTPTSSNSVTDNEIGTPTRLYWSLNASTDWIQWTVPAEGAGVDSLIVNVIGIATGGKLDVVKNPGASEVTIGEVDCLEDPTNVSRLVTVSGFDPLVAGDVIRFRWQGTDAGSRTICSFHGRASAVPATFDRPFAIPTATRIDGAAAGTWEYAYALAPTGSAKKFQGGVDHNGQPAACSEVSVTESWTKDGAAWTQDVGWTDGQFERRRQATIRYDATPTDIGTIDYTIQMYRKKFGCKNTFTATAALDLGALYTGMGRMYHTATLGRHTPNGSDFDITLTDDSEQHVAAGVKLANRGCVMGPTGAGAYLHWKTNQQTNAVYDAWVLMGTNAAKYYRRIYPGDTCEIGASWGGQWWAEYRTDNKYRAWRQDRRTMTTKMTSV